jgi:hypothetical protein
MIAAISVGLLIIIAVMIPALAGVIGLDDSA